MSKNLSPKQKKATIQAFKEDVKARTKYLERLQLIIKEDAESSRKHYEALMGLIAEEYVALLDYTVSFARECNS